MTGIGAIIIILQMGRMVGGEPPSGTIAAIGYLPTALVSINWMALALGAGTLAIVYTWPAKFGKIIPGPLVALIIGTVVSLIVGGAPVLGDIPSGLPTLHLPVFNSDQWMLIVEAAIILAILGAIDSLLTSLVADNMTRTRHESNRELVGQGIGNTFAGLLGGIGGAGATMRTVVNIRSGGQTKISGMTHSLVLLAIVLGLGPMASNIPHAVLAGILVKVGLDIIDWRYLKRAHKGPRWDLILMVLVLGLTVFVDLITAVAAGVVLAALAFVREVAQMQINELKPAMAGEGTPEEAELLKQSQGKISLFSFGGPMSFGAAADLGHHVRERAPKGSQVLILDFSRVPKIDVSAAMAVETIATDALGSGRSLVVSGANDDIKEVLKGLLSEYQEITLADDQISALKKALKEINPSSNDDDHLADNPALRPAST